jgi:hypothetical protein
MVYVEIYKLQNDGSQTVLATCRLIGEQVVCEGDSGFIQGLSEEGVKDYTGRSDKNFFFKDGRQFLEQLPYKFKSGYLNASKIKEN